MNDLTDLYSELLLDHGRNPRNRRAQPVPPAAEAEGFNPMCGDQVRVYVTLDGDRLADVSFEGKGCAISTASASMMTRAVVGKRAEEALSTLAAFHALLTGERERGAPEEMGELGALAGVRAFPMRVKCATLAWHALREAIEAARAGRHAGGAPVSTEEGAP